MESQEKSNESTPAQVRISLAVDTDALWSKPYPNTSEKDIDDCTFMSDRISQSPLNHSNKNFETAVTKGMNVKWTIASYNVSKVYVSLLSVSHNPTEGNPNYFDHDPLIVGQYGAVEGTIMNIENLPDDNYTINFKLFKGDEVRNYPLDPKLRISTKQK